MDEEDLVVRIKDHPDGDVIAVAAELTTSCAIRISPASVPAGFATLRLVEPAPLLALLVERTEIAEAAWTVLGMIGKKKVDTKSRQATVANQPKCSRRVFMRIPPIRFTMCSK
jgi:hypothetical protein